MELWVRSQDKRILKKCNYIRMHELIENEDYVLEDEEIDYGRYKTKERALEVLDEIQIEIDTYGGTMAQRVYEMPKE